MSTYTPIATQTLGSAAASVTFSSIPQGYTDLVVVCNSKNNTGSNYYLIAEFNSDTGANYSSTRLQGDGSAAASTRYTSASDAKIGYTYTTDFTLGIFQIQNYSNSTTYKTCLSRSNNASEIVMAIVSTWRNTNAITSINLRMEASAQIVAGSTFSIYGIAAGAVGAKAAGGIVTSDGSYVYHTFLNSSTFMPYQNLTCDYLVVAGGGGGGAGVGGGGGAGGYRTSIGGSPLSLTAQGYAVTVGAGGTGGVQGSSAGNNGNNSTISSITSTGGGGGGTETGSFAPGSGGSGGGGAGAPGSNRTGGTASPSGQGNAGGDGGGIALALAATSNIIVAISSTALIGNVAAGA